MDNPRYSESFDLPRQFDRIDSCEEPVDSDFVYENIISLEKLEHNELPPHDSKDNYKKASNDRSNNYKVSSINRSDRNDAETKTQHVVLPQTKPNKTISYWTRSYKQLLIGMIGGCLLTILIVVLPVYFSTKSKYHTDSSSKTVTDNYLPLKFDRSTLYRSAFLSEDGLTISNTYSRYTPVSSVTNLNTLRQYRGVIGNKCFDRNRKIYFEVQYVYSAISNYGPKNLIFEVGLAERERVDNYHYVGTTHTRGWSFYLNICNNKDNSTCLATRHNGDYLINPLPWNEISLESIHSGKFGFMVDTNQLTFSIVRNTSTTEQVIDSFQNVFSIQKLCPVLAVFNPSYFVAQLTLLNTYDFSNVAEQIIENPFT